jgi:hypothetical protein
VKNEWIHTSTPSSPQTPSGRGQERVLTLNYIEKFKEESEEIKIQSA